MLVIIFCTLGAFYFYIFFFFQTCKLFSSFKTVFFDEGESADNLV